MVYFVNASTSANTYTVNSIIKFRAHFGDVVNGNLQNEQEIKFNNRMKSNMNHYRNYQIENGHHILMTLSAQICFEILPFRITNLGNSDLKDAVYDAIAFNELDCSFVCQSRFQYCVLRDIAVPGQHS
jgi:hypothetical protein